MERSLETAKQRLQSQKCPAIIRSGLNGRPLMCPSSLCVIKLKIYIKQWRMIVDDARSDINSVT